MVRPAGLEPATPWLKAKCYCQLSYRRKILARPTGFEPVTLGLEIPCSVQLSYERKDQ